MKVFKINDKSQSGIFLFIAFFIFLLIIFTGFSVTSRAEETNVTVFVLDTAIDDDFVSRGTVREGKRISHGSMVGRIISEEAPGAELRSLSIDDKGNITAADPYRQGLITILDYQESNPRQKVLVNISLAFSNYEDRHHQLIKRLHEAGVMIIAAAGNDNTEEPVFPAGFEEVVAVANASKTGKAPSSNYGGYIDISAEGSIEFISRLYLPTGAAYHTLKAEGTSFAAPRVAGLAARILQMKPEYTPREALEIIKNTAVPINDKRFEQGQLGAGIISVSGALNEVQPYYQLKEILYSLAIIFSILLLGWGLIKKYGLASIFITLLILMVVVPFSLALGNQLFPLLTYLYHNIEQFQLNFYDIIFISSSFILVFLITGWEKRYLSMIYITITAGFLITTNFISFNPTMIRTYLLILFAVTTVLLMLSERWFIYVIRRKVNNPELLIKHINSYSVKISDTASDKLITEIDGSIGEDIKNLILYELNNVSRKNVGINLLKTLIDSDPPPVKQLITFALNHRSYVEPLKSLLKNRKNNDDNTIYSLLNVLNDRNYDSRKLAGDILKELDNERVITAVEEKLEEDRKIDKVILLEILASYSNKAFRLTDKIRQIIFQYDDMWLRYQALKTLTAIHPQPHELYSLLKKLTTDSQELIRLEAKGLLEEIKQKKEGAKNGHVNRQVKS